MSAPALILFDDIVARRWRPFTLTRPAGELLFGTRTLRDRAEVALSLDCAGHITAPHLADYDEPWGRPVIGAERVAGDVVLLLSRFVPDPGELPPAPALLVHDDRVVGCRVAADPARPDPRFFEDPDAAPPDLPRHPVEGGLLESVWELMARSGDRVARDLREGMSPLGRSTPGGSDPGAGVHVLGGDLHLGANVRIEPGVVLDTRHGPIGLADDVEVRPFSHVTGPAWVGPGSVLLGGRYEGITIGPVCKIHGEIEETVVLGYSNKAHDGFLGHAYLGAWVNLGALTTNSDLKNNYGSVRLWTPAGEADTGERKIGCFLGDHVKTAIGTMLNTGTVIEAGSNVFGGMPPKYLPPFSWGEADSPYDVDRFLGTAETVLGRRDIEMSDRQRALLRAAWREGRGGG